MIPGKWVDYDFRDIPPGQSAGLNEQSHDQLCAATAEIPLFSAAFPELMVPRSQWKERIERTKAKWRSTVQQIYGQGQEGSCVGFAGAQTLETTCTRRYGKQAWVSLSGMSVYRWIGSSAQSGAMISDGMKQIATVGALPVNSPENAAKYAHTHPRTGFKNQFATNWKDTAKLFRVTKHARCEGADEVGSALLAGLMGFVGRNGHSVPYGYLDYSGNAFLAAYANSWLPSWGDEGWGYDSERVFSNVDLLVAVEVSTRPDLDIPIL